MISSLRNSSKVGTIPIAEDADIGVILFAEVLFTFAMNFATVLALLGKIWGNVKGGVPHLRDDSRLRLSCSCLIRKDLAKVNLVKNIVF